jgi:biopolymer transport protein ExbD
MTTEQITKMEKAISNMKDKKSRIYFLVQDTKGNAKASVRYIYQMAMTLKKNGYNSIILHEKPEYYGVSDWLGEEYMTLDHRPIEGTNLEISPDDLIIVPEIYGFIMDQITKLPCGKVVLCQSYDYVFETLQPGQTWSSLGFLKCITTSEKQKEMVSPSMRNVSFDVIEPSISEEFTKSELPPKTIINVHTRDHRDTVNLIKTFYAKFPQYRWITFRDLRGLTEKEFANSMKESFVSIWIDQQSSYGTFPLESMKTGIPVIGLVPDMVPSWMNEDNGIWINNKTIIVDVLSDFIQNWLEDNLNPDLFVQMDKTVGNLQTEEKFESETLQIFEKMINTRMENFESQLNKFQTVE